MLSLLKRFRGNSQMKKSNNENECTAKKDDEPDFKKGAAQGLHRLLSACLKGSFEYRWFSLIAAFICWSIFLWVGIYEMLAGGGLLALVWLAIGVPPALIVLFSIRYYLRSKMFRAYKLDLLLLEYRSLSDALTKLCGSRKEETPKEETTSAAS